MIQLMKEVKVETILSDTQLQSLRDSSAISENEIAYKKGDLIIVENVLTKKRRILDTNKLATESNRRILKG